MSLMLRLHWRIFPPFYFNFMQSLAQFIAAALIKGTRRKFSTLMGDYLEKQLMSNRNTSSVTSSMNVADTPASRTQIGREIPDSPASLAAASAATLAGAPSSDSINSGMSCGSQLPAPVAKPVDRKTVEGSTPGDHRAPSSDTAKASLADCSDNGGPRRPMHGQRNSKHYDESGQGFQSTGNGSDSDAGN